MLLVLCAACAANEPARPDFDNSAGLVVIDVAGDGFVRVGDRREPWEAVVLELRQRTRAMTADEMQRFVVHLRADPQPAGSNERAVAQKTMNRLVAELEIMGVRQVKYL